MSLKEKQAAAKQTFVFLGSLANEYPAKQTFVFLGSLANEYPAKQDVECDSADS